MNQQTDLFPLKITPRTSQPCWLFLLPEHVLNIIYEFDSTYREKYRESVEEFDVIVRNHSSIQLRKKCYENLEGYSCTAFMGKIIPAIYKETPYFLPPITHCKSNIFRSFDIFCMKYNYYICYQKQEYIKIITQFGNRCQLCGSTEISPFRYKLKKPFNLYLFCSYYCHKKYYEDIDTYCRNTPYTQRPIYDKYNISTMAICYLPNYWHLHPENEQWEIVVFPKQGGTTCIGEL